MEVPESGEEEERKKGRTRGPEADFEFRQHSVSTASFSDTRGRGEQHGGPEAHPKCPSEPYRGAGLTHIISKGSPTALKESSLRLGNRSC